MAATPATKKPKGRSAWWRVHQWAGLQVSLFLAFVLLTGTLATLSHEIDWLITPSLRAAPAVDAPARWGKLYDAAHKAVPGGEVERLSAPYDRWFAAEALVRTADGKRVRVYLDPASGAVQGVHGWFNAQRLFRELHRHLMLPLKVGLPIVVLMALPLLASLVTAFWVYKKWWRGFFRLPRRQPKRKGDGRRFTGDLHRFAGLWSLWFITIIGLTGLWYLLEWAGAGAPPAQEPRKGIVAFSGTGADLDGHILTAQVVYPDLRISSVYFPAGKRGGVVVMGEATANLVRERANAVLIDPATGIVRDIQKGEALSVHQRIAEAADPLHFGAWGGFPVRLLWFLFGCILTGLAVTGVMIYGLRVAQQWHTPRAIPSAMWAAMGRMAWPSVAAVATGLALAVSRFG